jgi:hypothetical protein
METPVDDTFRRDARTFRLKQFCEDCAHFDGNAHGCAEGYPNDSHRAVLLDSACRVVFCKSFELV